MDLCQVDCVLEFLLWEVLPLPTVAKSAVLAALIVAQVIPAPAKRATKWSVRHHRAPLSFQTKPIFFVSVLNSVIYVTAYIK